jgi:hypothetical protein
LNQISQNGSFIESKSGVDLYNLKIFALLMCRGELSEKAGIIFDLIMVFNKEKDPEKRILRWNHPRLRKAIKMLVYLSEILPKKY